MNEKNISLIREELSRKVNELYKFNYEGIKLIVSRKFNDEANDKDSNFNRFVFDLQKTYTNVNIKNYIHLNFPNYVAIFDFNNLIIDNVEKRTSFIICISLLVDYYTLYFCDSFYFLDYCKMNLDSHKVPPNFTIHSFESSPNISNFDIELLKSKIQVFFPQKKYYPHNILKKWKNKGISPFGEEPEMAKAKDFSLFELLFDNQVTFSSRYLEILD